MARAFRPASDAAPTLPGLNIDGALSRLGIGFDALTRMLIRFGDGQVKTVADLRVAVDAGDAAAIARHAHAIAGAAGNLGADTLREASKALETSARAGGGNLAELAARVEELAAVVFRSIDTLRTPAARPDEVPTDDPQGLKARDHGADPQGLTDRGPADPAALRKALLAVQEAVSAGDPEAAAAGFDALSALPLADAARAAVNRARTLADDYQFDDAGREIGVLLDGKTI